MQQVQTLNPGAAPQTACECALKRLISQQIAAAGVVSICFTRGVWGFCLVKKYGPGVTTNA